ncbi:hypothetical protein K0U07_01440 [bacterium]|nr:hypothetical protein [bacterium]
MTSPTTPDPDKLDPLSGRGQSSPSDDMPDQNAFKGHMEDKEANPLQQQAKGPSPIDLANQQKMSPSAPPTMDKIHQQMTSVSGSLGDIKNKLQNKNLKLKNSDKYLVRKKLGNANEHIKAAAKKTGADTGDFEKKLNQSKNPIARFLSMVSDGQHQMVQAADSIKKLNANGKKMQPGDLLLVQIKLNKAQQELNYTSVILGNATSMIKTLFNIQI